jgi:uncharacterized membrane protein
MIRAFKTTSEVIILFFLIFTTLVGLDLIPVSYFITKVWTVWFILSFVIGILYLRAKLNRSF